MYAAVSVDGRTTGFLVDLGLFYSLAQQWGEDATLAGCDTLLKAAEGTAEETASAAETAAIAEPPDHTDAPEAGDPPGSGDPRPLLVVPDSRGRIRDWHFWKKQPYWRQCVTLCTARTPAAHLEYLAREGVRTILAGTGHVDFVQALEQLNREFGVTTIRVDSGGTLNGVLLRAGLVDELHLLVHPVLVGGIDRKTFFADPDPLAKEAAHFDLPLRYLDAKSLDGGLLLLSYSV